MGHARYAAGHLMKMVRRPMLKMWFSTVLLVISLVAWETAGFDSFCASKARPRGTAFPLHGEASCDQNDSDLWKKFMERFQGDFDNYDQVVRDRALGMEPREGGGHEHIHCTLVPLLHGNNDSNNKSQKILAAFYFDGIPQRIFRFRLYELFQLEDWNINMKLYTLHPALEKQIRQSHTEDPMEWPNVYKSFLQTTPGDNSIKELEKCDVQWSLNVDPTQHTYMDQQTDKDAVHAVMIYGEALVESQMIPGTQIRVKDQLSFWKDEFWIHDRGFDPDTAAFIYGNQRGVPYQMKRVTNIATNDKTNKRYRLVVSSSLQWTLGPQWRTEEDYQSRMERIGGVSTKLNS